MRSRSPQRRRKPRKQRGLSTSEQRELFARTDVEETVLTHEAAPLLRIAPQTMRRWACYGDGPIRPTRVGGRLRWALSDIRKILPPAEA
jgi:hypothetical protein